MVSVQVNHIPGVCVAGRKLRNKTVNRNSKRKTSKAETHLVYRHEGPWKGIELGFGKMTPTIWERMGQRKMARGGDSFHPGE